MRHSQRDYAIMMNFIVIAAMGLMLLVLVKDSKVRRQRQAGQAGAVALVGLGVAGAIYSGFAAS
ncbi:hypothetical protein AAW01_04695 [Aurantiacibacter gangjinensis]|uniref:Uncharacterized protein n=2 Tax=Aurantiacibacter gangjinensis TaxID=502682 RepID=A0A0G9MR96_9SPHN|nr:hypothetical protein AAW01_04695 [Aurantiacibacter gangjinensis]